MDSEGKRLAAEFQVALRDYLRLSGTGVEPSAEDVAVPPIVRTNLAARRYLHLADRLAKTQQGRRELERMLTDADPAVRVAVAARVMVWNEALARPVLEGAASQGSGLSRLASQIALEPRKAGPGTDVGRGDGGATAMASAGGALASEMRRHRQSGDRTGNPVFDEQGPGHAATLERQLDATLLVHSVILGSGLTTACVSVGHLIDDARNGLEHVGLPLLAEVLADCLSLFARGLPAGAAARSAALRELGDDESLARMTDRYLHAAPDDESLNRLIERALDTS